MRIGSRASATLEVGSVAVSVSRRQRGQDSGHLELVGSTGDTNLFERPLKLVPLRTCRRCASELRFLLLDPVLLQSVLP
jgi:hypothetical protein